MQGRIIKGIAGFYYIYAENDTVYECKAKGVFRKDKKKPMVGDEVVVDILDEEEKKGNIVDLLPRKNELIRPAVANVDQALIVFALTHPEPNFLLLDKLLLQYRMQNLPVIICFNKEDLSETEEVERVREIYENSGAKLIFTCTKTGSGIAELGKMLEEKLSCVSGPSGVGKSSIINCLQDSIEVETGNISEKSERGKHTTRHSEIIPINSTTYIMDTPGFSSFDVLIEDKDMLPAYYNEFMDYDSCRFMPCSHTHEPGCFIKEAVSLGNISKIRYDNYVSIYEELKNLRRY